jgi:NAD(P)-dependent dehydrogenase (short-subunit alcohol dehydrogenase family)
MVALKHMKPRNRCTIIQVGSALAYRSIPLQGAYCGAKRALRGFTDSLRSELIHDKSDVHLTMVHLSAFNTPQFEWGKTCFEKRPQPVPAGRQDNLYAPVAGDHGAHRRFDNRSKSASWQMQLAIHRGALTVAALALMLYATTRRALR